MTLVHPREAELIAAAQRAHGNAYAPYSGFWVGAAVLAESGAIYLGCNVENATYGATVCAERNAVGAAVVAGERRLEACVVFTKHSRATPPCGVCRQVLLEFGPDLLVVSVTASGLVTRAPLSELLPSAFGPSDLGK